MRDMLLCIAMCRIGRRKAADYDQIGMYSTGSLGGQVPWVGVGDGGWSWGGGGVTQRRFYVPKVCMYVLYMVLLISKLFRREGL
jgi:hypothetical protein